MDLKIRLQYVSVALLAVAGEGALFCNTNQADAQATKSAGIMSGALRDTCIAYAIGSLGGFVVGNHGGEDVFISVFSEAMGQRAYEHLVRWRVHQSEELSRLFQAAGTSMCVLGGGFMCAAGTFFTSLAYRIYMHIKKLQSDNERFQAQVSGA